jgi:hypothetical protein
VVKNEFEWNENENEHENEYMYAERNVPKEVVLMMCFTVLHTGCMHYCLL